jgi:hypothetical protein
MIEDKAQSPAPPPISPGVKIGKMKGRKHEIVNTALTLAISRTKVAKEGAEVPLPITATGKEGKVERVEKL